MEFVGCSEWESVSSGEAVVVGDESSTEGGEWMSGEVIAVGE